MVTQAQLKDNIHYDPITGVFVWIKSRGFIKAGTLAGGNGKMSLDGKRYQLKRLMWLYITGVYPSCNLKPIDGNVDNFIFTNWRVDDYKTCNSDHTNIGLMVNDNSYSVFIIKEGRTIDLGIYDDVDIALKAARGRICST